MLRYDAKRYHDESTVRLPTPSHGTVLCALFSIRGPGILAPELAFFAEAEVRSGVEAHPRICTYTVCGFQAPSLFRSLDMYIPRAIISLVGDKG